MVPSDHARITCPRCGADLLQRGRPLSESFVLYSWFCAECESEPATFPEPAPVPYERAQPIRPARLRPEYAELASIAAASAPLGLEGVSLFPVPDDAEPLPVRDEGFVFTIDGNTKPLRRVRRRFDRLSRSA